MKQQKVFTLPNTITLVRLLLAPVLFWVILNKELLWAATLFALIIFTDWLDGFLARKLKQESRIGIVLDATADVVVIASVITGLYVINMFPRSWFIIILVLWLLGFIFQIIAKLRRKDHLYKSLPAAKISGGALYVLLILILLNSPMAVILPVFIIVVILSLVRVYVYFRRML